MRPEICGHAEWPNAAGHHQLGLLCALNRGGQSAPHSCQLLGPCTAQNGGNGKALAANREPAAGSRRQYRTVGARDALICLARGTHRSGAPLASERCPTSVETAPRLRRNRAPPFIEIPPHFDSESGPGGNEMMETK